jgi:uncharacterized glyoxalase superfamily protein PhnB
MTFTSVTPYLYYADAGEALDWLERVFGFGARKTVTGDEGRVEEAEIAVGAQRIMMTGRAPGADEGSGALVIVGVDDVDALRSHILAQGVGVEPARDEDYGPRTIHVTDPWGYRWYFWQGDAEYPA